MRPQCPNESEHSLGLLHRLPTKDAHPIALVGRIEEGVGQPVDRNQSAGLSRVEEGDPAASYLQCDATDE
jgi:hypothetical protein